MIETDTDSWTAAKRMEAWKMAEVRKKLVIGTGVQDFEKLSWPGAFPRKTSGNTASPSRGRNA